MYFLNSLFPMTPKPSTSPQPSPNGEGERGVKSATKRRFRFCIRDYVLKPTNYYFFFLSPFGEPAVSVS